MKSMLFSLFMLVVTRPKQSINVFQSFHLASYYWVKAMNQCLSIFSCWCLLGQSNQSMSFNLFMLVFTGSKQ